MLLSYVWRIGLVLLLMTGCSNTDHLVPRCVYETEVVGKDFWFDAPYIVVGKAIDSKFASSRTIADADGRIELL